MTIQQCVNCGQFDLGSTFPCKREFKYKHDWKSVSKNNPAKKDPESELQKALEYIEVLNDAINGLRAEIADLKKSSFKGQCDKIFRVPADGYPIKFGDDGEKFFQYGDEIYLRSYMYTVPPYEEAK